MLIRVKFSKYGLLRFIGHLDVMRYFQKAVVRAGIDIKYSQGFHPHQIMSFAAPLGVGITSSGEYMDIELVGDYPCFEIQEALKSVMAEGIDILRVTELSPRELNVKKESSMALVDAADYLLYRRDGHELPLQKQAFIEAFTKWCEQETLPTLKRSKKNANNEKEIDLKPYLFCYAFTKEEFEEKRDLLLAMKEPVSIPKLKTTGEQFSSDDICIFLQLSAGSEVNIKPELLMEAFYTANDFEFDKFAFQTHRIELYSDSEEGRVPLWAVK